ncbi:hypothetical protein FPV67DRAFT_161712 [Lyophyllum atratum]|nr:hypothetical protein FPV67DRAFT_161712 [Lyophyllum atratum]
MPFKPSSRTVDSRRWEQPAVPPHVQNIVDLATREPLRYLPSLIRLFKEQQLWTLTSQLLPLLIRPFELNPPSGRVTPQDKTRVEVAQIALEGLSDAQYLAQGSEARISLLNLSYILPAWPSIWKWIQYLYYKTEDGHLDMAFDAESRPAPSLTSISEDTMQLFDAIQFFLALTILGNTSPHLSSIIISSPGLLEMLTEMWLRQCRRLTEANDTHDAPMARLASQALAGILISHPIDISQLADGFGVGQERLADLLIEPIHSMAHRSGGKLIDTCVEALCIYLRLAKKAPGIFKMLLARDFLVYVLHTLRHILSLPPPESEDVHRYVSSCFILIADTSSMSVDYTWIIDAIRENLIPCILQYASLAIAGTDGPDGVVGDDEEDREEYLIWVTTLLESYFLHRPVLKLLGRVMRAKSVTSLSMKIPCGTKFSTVWTGFLENVDAQLSIHTSFKKSVESKMQCSSPNCANMETTPRFRACERCQDVIYCSKPCQREDWIEGSHRTDCAAACKTRSGQPFRFSLRDRAFLAFLVDHWLKVDNKRITDYRDIQISRSGRQPMILSIFDMKSPPTIDLDSAKDFEQWSNPSQSIPNSDGSRTTSWYSDQPPPSMVIPLPNISKHSAEPRPLIQPCLFVNYAAGQYAAIYTPSKVSGDLFGWVDTHQ